MDGNLGKFIEDSHKLIGAEALDVPSGWPNIDWPAVRRLATALGDRNDLYFDPMYAVRTRYQSVAAPPAYLVSVRAPAASGAFNYAPYGLAPMQSGVEFEWFDVMRLGQRLRSELKLSSVNEGSLESAKLSKEVAELGCEASYKGLYEGVIGRAKGKMTFVPFESGKEFFVDRGIYRYSDEEIAKITGEMDDMIKTPPRGMVPLYHDTVSIGDELPQLIKHLTLEGLLQWTLAEGRERLRGPILHQNLKRMPGRIVTNPSTKWPYWDLYTCNDDVNSCRAGGYNAPYARGLMVACLASQLLTNWIGDDGFLRRLRMDLSVPNAFLYGDTMWIRGKVADKYREKVGEETYRAVDIDIEETNQLGETLGRGSATVYLPERGYEVNLPVPLK